MRGVAIVLGQLPKTIWEETEFDDLRGVLEVRAEMNGAPLESAPEELTPWDRHLIEAEKAKAALADPAPQPNK